MQTLWQDLTLAGRLLRNSPGFTVAAVVTLALGIGANAAMFALADATLFQPLPLPDADRLVHVFQRHSTPGVYPLSYAEYHDYRANARAFESLAAHYTGAPLYVRASGESESLTGAVVTASYFDVLGLSPARGRFFTQEEDRVPDRDAVAVISDAFWRRRFGRDPSALGSTIEVNGRPFTVIGVTPSGFAGVHPRVPRTDVFIPTAMFQLGYRYCDAFRRDCTIVHMIGKLRPGTTVDAAQRDLDAIAQTLYAHYPPTDKRVGVAVVAARGLGYGRSSEETRQIQLFTAVVALVLLIACANIAGLQLARATGRRKEIAMRHALGASRPRIVRQMLTESGLLACLGCGAGLLAAAWGSGLIEALYAHDSAGRPVAFHLTLNISVIAATIAVTAVAAVIFGIVPALHATRGDVMSAIKCGSGAGGGRRGPLRQVLVIGQLALSVTLLVGALLLVESVRHLYAGPGYDARPLVMMRLRPSLIDYSREKSHAYQREVIRRLEAVPGVLSASPSVFPIIGGGIRLAVSDRPTDRAEDRVDAMGGHGGARYFETIGVPLLEGRDFTEQDDLRAPRVAIVNDVLARQLWPNEEATGRTLTVENEPHSVIGVVRDAQYYLAGEAPRPQVFLSYWQPQSADPFLNDSRLLVRVAGDPRSLMPTLRRAVSAVDPLVPRSEDYPLAERVAFFYQPVRMARTLLVAFAGLAVILSAIGLYGVLASMVAQRTREIGIRMALGARRKQVAALVLREGMVMVAAGVAIGLVAAWMFWRLIASLLYGVQWNHPVSYALAPAVLMAVALLAIYLPARRAAGVSPLSALRYE